MIDLRNIYKEYILGDEIIHAVDGISLYIAKHEFAAIIGASGSGKSTLMNIIGCLDMPDRGQYILNGKNITEYTDNELATLRNEEIGFVFQQFHLLPKLSALENVELPLVYQGMPLSERRRKSMEALRRVGLGSRTQHRPNQMSGGQQQRVAIARALVTNPSLILADEPTGNLDSHSSYDIMGLFHDLHEEGNTIILITHDVSVAKEAHRRVELIDGQIISDTKDDMVAPKIGLPSVQRRLTDGEEDDEYLDGWEYSDSDEDEEDSDFDEWEDLDLDSDEWQDPDPDEWEEYEVLE